jgi:hypothetical protein
MKACVTEGYIPEICSSFVHEMVAIQKQIKLGNLGVILLFLQYRSVSLSLM